MAKDAHNLGTFHTLDEVWQAYPLGGNCDDYVFIDGLRYDWNVYDRQWLTSVIYHEQEWIFDISEFDFAEQDWREMADGIYSVCNEGTPIGRLLIRNGNFYIDGYLAIYEGEDGEYSEVKDGNEKGVQSKVTTSDTYNSYVYSGGAYTLNTIHGMSDAITITAGANINNIVLTYKSQNGTTNGSVTLPMATALNAGAVSASQWHTVEVIQLEALNAVTLITEEI